MEGIIFTFCCSLYEQHKTFQMKFLIYSWVNILLLIQDFPKINGFQNDNFGLNVGPPNVQFQNDATNTFEYEEKSSSNFVNGGSAVNFGLPDLQPQNQFGNHDCEDGFNIGVKKSSNNDLLKPYGAGLGAVNSQLQNQYSETYDFNEKSDYYDFNENNSIDDKYLYKEPKIQSFDDSTKNGLAKVDKLYQNVQNPGYDYKINAGSGLGNNIFNGQPKIPLGDNIPQLQNNGFSKVDTFYQKGQTAGYDYNINAGNGFDDKIFNGQPEIKFNDYSGVDKVYTNFPSNDYNGIPTHLKKDKKGDFQNINIQKLLPEKGKINKINLGKKESSDSSSEEKKFHTLPINIPNADNHKSCKNKHKSRPKKCNSCSEGKKLNIKPKKLSCGKKSKCIKPKKIGKKLCGK